LPTCSVWIDGTRFADGSTPGETDTTPVALSGLSIVWGRDNTLDQPEPGTATFQVLDVAGGALFTDQLRIGTHVDVRAEATIYPDPTTPIFTYNAGFEGMTVGAVPPSSVSGGAVTVSSEQAHAGTRSAKLTPTGRPLTVIFPPAPFGNDSAWDAVPRTFAGQTWRFGASVWLSQAGYARVRPVGFTRPDPSTEFRIDGFDLLPNVATTGWQVLAGDILPPPEIWLGIAVDLTAPQWDEVDPYLTWDTAAAGLRWDDMGLAYVDDLVLLAPAAGALRRSTVFSGRITDLQSQYDLDVGGTIVDVTAQTHLAELNNRYVGAEPWLAESLAARFARIVTASGQAVEYLIDPSVAGLPVTWRDVDNQPSGELMHQLAQSVAGALWSASSDVGEPYVWLEDINQRPSQYVLVKQGGIVVIAPSTEVDPERIVIIDACDIVLDPVTWSQSTEDNATRVVVSWQDQTLDDEGQPKPTTRDVTADDPTAEAATGRRRIQISTQLAVQTDATLVAQAVLARVSTPGWRLSGLTWEMATTDRLDADTLDIVMQLLDGVTKLGIGIRLTNMPNWLPPASGADVNLFLEGGTYRNIDGAWILELQTSSAVSQGQSNVRWDDLPGATGPAATRTNRATNPRAVTGGATGWEVARGFGTGGAGTYSYLTAISTPPIPGVTTARRKTWSTAASNNSDSGFEVRATATTRLAVTAGQTYTVSVYLRQTSGGSKTARLKLHYWDRTAESGAAPVGTWQESADTPISSGAWTRLSVTAVAPAGAAGLGVWPDIVAGGTNWAVGNTLDAAALLIEQAVAPAGTYYDGATPDAAPFDYAWTGAANNSTSTCTDTTAATTGWRWDDFDPGITWNALHGVGV
jgi:hypothetical protein